MGIDGQTDVRLYKTRHASAKYAVLSYMWDHKEDNLRTIVARVEEHKARIHIAAMLWTFQDAVITTRRLVLRYPRIDALR